MGSTNAVKVWIENDRMLQQMGIYPLTRHPGRLSIVTLMEASRPSTYRTQSCPGDKICLRLCTN